MLPEIFNNVEAVFFDLDNTLINRDLAFRDALFIWINQTVPGISADRRHELMQKILIKDVRGHTDRKSFYTWMSKEITGGHPSLHDISNFFSAQIPLHVQPDDDVIQLIKSLQKTFLVGIITNGSSSTQRAKLHHSRLIELFDPAVVYIEGEVGVAKPDEKIFRRAMADHGISPFRALFVGDHFEHDIIGAAACGWKTLWVANGQKMSDTDLVPDFVIEDIYHLKFSVIHA